jgi:tRNA-(ms[2]io[6]A)-hydroxylase
MRIINEFLLCATPNAWLARALTEPEILLIDHANCEKKAASTAINLMYRYVDNFDLLNKMSRLAREELRHFEQVIGIIEKRGIVYDATINAGRYATQLRKPVRTYEPAKLVDTLIVGAIIEARSCERFACLAPLLDGELQKFYVSLLKSEARHFMDYLSLARAASNESIDSRIEFFLNREKELIEGPDEEFRFHSGVPV